MASQTGRQTGHVPSKGWAWGNRGEPTPAASRSRSSRASLSSVRVPTKETLHRCEVHPLWGPPPPEKRQEVAPCEKQKTKKTKPFSLGKEETSSARLRKMTSKCEHLTQPPL